jgi:hypothetical protein
VKRRALTHALLDARAALLLLVLLAANISRADDCPPYRELRPPQLALDGSVLWLTRALDLAWFQCARKAGGKLVARSEVERAGAWDLDSSESNPSADLRLGAWASNYCGRSGKVDPTRVRFVIEGQGPLAQASYTSPPRPALCGCTVYPTTDLRASRSADGLALKASLTAAHLACLREGPGSLEVRAYTGRTAEEAKARARPAWVLRGIESRPQFTATLPRQLLCAGGAKVAVLELAGKGSFAKLTGSGQVEVALDCK